MVLPGQRYAGGRIVDVVAGKVIMFGFVLLAEEVVALGRQMFMIASVFRSLPRLKCYDCLWELV